MYRRLFVFWLLIVYSSLLSASENIKIAVLAFRSKPDTLAQWAPTAQYLSKKIPGYTFEIVPMNFPQIREAAASGEVAFIITNSGHYVYLEKSYGISRIATMMIYKKGEWLDRFGGAIFCRSGDSSCNTLDDIKGKKIATVDTDSLGGYSSEMFELSSSNIAQKNISLLFTGMPHDNVVHAVLSGKADVGFIRTGVLEDMAREGKLDLDKIKILGSKTDLPFPYLHSTALYPQWPISRMPKTSQHLADKVVVALLSMPRDISPAEGSVGWTAPLEYGSIHEVFETLRLPPYDQPQRFDLGDVYERYKLFIIALALLSLGIIITVIREFKLRQKLQELLDEQTKTQAQTKLSAMVFENNNDAIVISDAEVNGHVISVNPAFEKLTGYRLDEIRGKKTNLLYSGHHDKIFYDVMWNAINTTGSWEGEIVDRHKEGYLFSKWLTIRTVYHDDGRPFRRIAIFSDFTSHKEAQKQIWYQANFDLLTALPNRNMFMYRLEKELHEIERTKQSLALMFLDLDNFKEVNDSLGHDEGDILLQVAARRITHCVRKDDVVSRLGGDEFTIILPHIDDQRVIDKIAAAILTELSKPFDLRGEKAFISASIGITVAPGDGTGADILLKNADQAMYSAKKEGRNQYHYFTPSMQNAVYQRRMITNDMRGAIERGEFTLYYQPIVEMGSNTVHKAEALIRWKKSDGTMVSPADFIPLAEETGMIIEIGKWVFEEATAQLKLWRERFDPTFKISINTSPLQFRSESAQCTKLFEMIDSGSLSPDAIVIEITEGMLMEQSETIAHVLREFAHRGVTLSIDDFGTGYSSLSYLKKFDIDFLKIDQSFVRNLETDTDNQILCEAIMMMAHRLGIQVVAEGVETHAQREYLRSIHCDFIQGYLIARPLSADEFQQKFFESTHLPL